MLILDSEYLDHEDEEILHMKFSEGGREGGWRAAAQVKQVCLLLRVWSSPLLSFMKYSLLSCKVD